MTIAMDPVNGIPDKYFYVRDSKRQHSNASGKHIFKLQTFSMTSLDL